MDYAFRGRRPSIMESREAHQLLANAFGGTLRMRMVASQYIRLPDGMNSGDYSKYTRGAPFSPFARGAVEAWMGLIEGKPHLLKGTESVRFKQEGIEYGIDHLIRHVLENVLSYGRIAIVSEPTGEIVTYLPEDEVEMKFERDRLSRAVFQDSEGELLCYELDADGFVTYHYADLDKMPKAEPQHLIYEGKKISNIPVVFVNPFDLSYKRDHSPVLEIANLSIAHWSLSLQQAEALFLTASPQPVVTGVNDAAEVPRTLGPSKIWTFSNPEAKAYLLAYTGDGLTERRSEIMRLETLCASIGASMLLPKGVQHTAARSIELKSREQSSNLVLIVRNCSTAIEMAVKMFAANPNAITVKINEDLIDSQMSAELLRALNELRRDGNISFDTMIRVLQKGEILPSDILPEDEAARIKDDPVGFGAFGSDRQREVLNGSPQE